MPRSLPRFFPKRLWVRLLITFGLVLTIGIATAVVMTANDGSGNQSAGVTANGDAAGLGDRGAGADTAQAQIEKLAQDTTATAKGLDDLKNATNSLEAYASDTRNQLDQFTSIAFGILIFVTIIVGFSLFSLYREQQQIIPFLDSMNQDLAAFEERIKKLETRPPVANPPPPAAPSGPASVPAMRSARKASFEPEVARQTAAEIERQERQAALQKLETATELFRDLMNRGTAQRNELDEIIESFPEKWMIAGDVPCPWNNDAPREHQIVMFGDRQRLSVFPAFYARSQLASGYHNEARIDPVFHNWFHIVTDSKAGFQVVEPARATITFGSTREPLLNEKGTIALFGT